MSIVPNTTLSHYIIISKLGAGGMGEVYLAQDTKLDRKVALKVLPQDVAADRSRMNRFVQEAKSASALNHPNIITIHEIDETDSGHFIATEFIDGETLRECLRKTPLTIREALNVVVQIAAALTAAHQAGIIHRDIKPENVMVRADGLVKVLDFGLAKLTATSASDPEGATRISDTQPGMIMGTVAYMSPEQARGKAVDGRTDVWSLGVLLYEMLSGRPPFQGETASDTLANILHREPDRLNIGALPDDLVRILDRMLAKNLDSRYPSIADAASDLKSLQKRIEFDSEMQQTVLRSSVGAHTEIIPSFTGTKRVNETAADSASSRTDEGFWVAVLPFKYPGSNSDLEALAEGLSEDIVTGLSRFPHLRVIARSSTSRFSGASGDVRSIGKELGARYVMEGSLRHAARMLRVTVQLLDSTTGAHLWAETYNRDLAQADVFAVQDDLTDRVVATVADSYGVLVRSMAASVEEKAETELTASDWVLRQYRYRQLLTPEEHAKVRDGLESFVEREPKHAAPWACLAQLYVDEFVFKFNQRPNSLDRALAAARRSVDLDRTFQYGNQILAQVHFFRRDTAAFRTTAEQAMVLNSRDTDTLAMMGLMLVHIGEFERGANIVRRAMDLNPNHAGWYHFAIIWEHLNKGDYEKALARITRVNMPGLFWQPLTIASICGLLGRSAEALAAVQDLRKLDPDFEQHVREYIEVWHYSSGLMDRILEGLSKAGVEIAQDPETLRISSPVTVRTAIAESAPSIAVLPFVNLSNDPDNDYFCDGLAEELLNALAKIDDLKVAARTSAFSFKDRNVDVGEIARTLNVNTILEGSVRMSMNRIRITAQLVNAGDGYHLWSERYDCELKDIFDVQDEITVAVVEALKVKLFGEEKNTVLKRHTRNPEAHEFYLRGLFYSQRFTHDGFQKATEGFRTAIDIDPHYALAYAGLANAYSELALFSFSPSEATPKAREAATKALALDDTLAEPHNSLAIIKMYFDWDYLGAEQEFKRAIALNPGSALIHQWYGWYLNLMGRFDKSLKEMRRAQELDPLSATINSGIGILFHWSRQPDRAIKQFQKVFELDPNYHIAVSVLAEAYVQKGDFASAIATIEKIQQGEPDPFTLSTVGYVYAKSGDRDKALEILNEFEKRSNEEYVPALNFAQIYAGFGDNEQALAWLEKACDERAVWMTFLKVDLKFDPLRSDPRFQELLKKVGFPEV